MAIKVNKKTVKIVVWVGAAAVAAYFLYQWYQNRQASAGGNTNTSGGGITSGLGTNLNSVNPVATAADNGNMAGPAYYGGAINVDVSQPVTPAPPTPPVASPPTTPPTPPTPPKHPVHTGGGSDRTTHPKVNSSPWSSSNSVHRSPPRGKPSGGGGNKSGAHK
jgi:hypothetical protein